MFICQIPEMIRTVLINCYGHNIGFIFQKIKNLEATHSVVRMSVIDHLK